jgi:hypothetical protein
MVAQILPRTLQPPPDVPELPSGNSMLATYLRTFALWCRHGFADKLSATTASPGLMLQAYNPPANVPPNVYRLEVGQDGRLYLAPLALGSGDAGAPVPVDAPVDLSGYMLKAGVTDGSNALAGQIGEYISASRGTALGLTSAVSTNITSIALTAGDWDIRGNLNFSFTPGTTCTILGGASTASATLPTFYSVQGIASSNTGGFEIPVIRVSSASPVTVYLIGYAVFGTGSVTCTGTIVARRAR